MPLAFEVNVGQTADAASFIARGQAYTMWATTEGPVLRLVRANASNAIVKLRVVGGEPQGHPTAESVLPGRANYFIGNEPSLWKTNVARFGALRYSDVYPGVDLILHGTQESLEYDFAVAPHADPLQIAVSFDGASSVRIEPTGDLTLTVNGGELGFHPPVAYQERNGERELVAARYEITGDTQVHFALGDYDAARPLVIDPVLSYSTYLGGTQNFNGGSFPVDQGNALAVDASGNAYLTGFTAATDFPLAGASYDSTCAGCAGSGGDAFVAKIDPSQSGAASLVFSTYLGTGGTGSSTANGVAVDIGGNVYVTGTTGGYDIVNTPLNEAFPTTANAFQPNDGGDLAVSDAFLTKLDPNGSSLLYSTYLGGSGVDEGNAVRADDFGKVVVVGRSEASIFPPLKNGYQMSKKGGFDAFVVKFDTLLSGAASLTYGTMLGGSTTDAAGAVALDGQGRIYVTGDTQSTQAVPLFPTLNGFQTTGGGGTDAFVAVINPALAGAASLVYSTFIGGDGTETASTSAHGPGGGIAVDATGIIYATGSTSGAVNKPFPTTAGAFKTSLQQTDAYLVKIDPSLVGPPSLLAGTLLGGAFADDGYAIVVDGFGNPVVTGGTGSSDFPITGCGMPKQSNGDGFITVFDPSLTGLKFSTMLGGAGTERVNGIAVNSQGALYVAGSTDSLNFPTTANAFDPTHQSQCNGCGSTDVFLTVISSPLDLCPVAPVATGFSTTTPEDTPKLLTLNATDLSGNNAQPDSLSWEVTVFPTHGLLDVSSGPMAHGAGPAYATSTTYSPAANYFGSDSFKFRAFDGTAYSAEATVLITVTSVNDPPTANSQSVTTAEETPKLITLTGSDPENQFISFFIDATPLHGMLSGSGANRTYTPATNYFGPDSFTFHVTDSFGAASATATVTINVTNVNDAPVAAADSATTTEDVPATVNVLANDTDVDNDTLSVTLASCNNGAGAAINVDQTMSVTPALNFNGTVTCSYTANDGHGGTSSAQLAVTVTAANDNPTAATDAATTPEDVPVTINVLANDSDIDGDSLTVSAPSCNSGAGAQVNGNNTLTVSPALNFHGTITCTYTANDGHGGTATGQLTVTVDAVNDAPSANNDAASTQEDVPVTVNVLANDSDVDGDSLTVSAPSCNFNAGVQVNANNTLAVSPAVNFNGTITCSYTVSDGHGGSSSASLVVTVTAVNDSPSAAADTASTSEDTPIAVNVVGNDSDPDGDSLTVTSPSCNSGAGAQVNADNTITVSPALNFNGTISCSYTLNDGQGGTATGQLSVTVTAVNDNPIAAPDTASTDDNTLIIVAVLGNDSDPDGNSVALDSIGSCQVGELEQNADGTVTYKPKLGYGGADVCSYTVTDGVGGTASGQLTVNVTKLNVKPTINAPGNQQTEEGTAVALQVIANDPDGDTLTYSATGLPNGLAIDPVTGLISGAPAAGTWGSHQVTVTVNDNNGGTKSVTFTWVVTLPNGVNQLPQCSAAQPSMSSVWPPNHKLLVPIQILGVTDPDGGQPTITITGILQDEPTVTLGDGTTWIDGFGVGTSTAQIRAERSGTAKVPGNGRVYEIFFTAADAHGASCSGSVLVGVPHDDTTGPAVDDIVRYDSTVSGGQPINKP